MKPRDLEFLFEISAMRNMERGWKHQLGMDCANDVEHTFRVMFIALLLARMEGGVDENKVLKMALMHDIDESRTGDAEYVQKRYVSADSERVLKDMFDNTSFDDLRTGVAQEYHARETLEAKIVKDADNIDIDLELRELEDRGSLLPRKWKETTRRLVREEKLYTDSAKKLWDAIWEADPTDWHRKANKWIHMPEAGK